MTDYIFNPDFFRKDKMKSANVPPRDLSIGQAISFLDLPENKKKEITDYLQSLTLHIFNKDTKQIEEQELDLNKHKMIDLWREHDYWTYQILRPYMENGLLNEAIVLVASSHHTLEGHYPITLEINKFPIKISEIQTSLPKSAVKLELADKYFTKNLQKVSVALALVDKYQAWRDRSKKNHEEAIAEIKKEINNSQDEGRINHDHAVFNMFIEAVDLIDKKFRPKE